jgi:predicted O-methyltransferase YrrM
MLSSINRATARDIWNLAQVSKSLGTSPLLDIMLPRWSAPRASGFNGQRGRQRLLREVLKAWTPRLVVETGTYRGDTTELLWYVTGAPVVSIERNGLFARAATNRFKKRDDIEIVHSDSLSYLQAWGTSLPRSDVLFYIDSHWKDHLPIADEIDCITQGWRRSLILIDDIQVPDDEGYGYFDEGPEALTVDSIAGRHGGYRVFWPALPSDLETGGRRGCCVLVAEELATTIGSLPALRAHE